MMKLEQNSNYYSDVSLYESAPTAAIYQQPLQVNTQFHGLNLAPVQLSPPIQKERFSYTRYQLEIMDAIYRRIKYPNKMQKHLISKRIGITKDQVKIWFQNRRRKDVVSKQKTSQPWQDERIRQKQVESHIVESIVTELLNYEQTGVTATAVASDVQPNEDRIPRASPPSSATSPTVALSESSVPPSSSSSGGSRSSSPGSPEADAKLPLTSLTPLCSTSSDPQALAYHHQTALFQQHQQQQLQHFQQQQFKMATHLPYRMGAQQSHPYAMTSTHQRFGEMSPSRSAGMVPHQQRGGAPMAEATAPMRDLHASEIPELAFRHAIQSSSFPGFLSPFANIRP